jgi:hypothetical protein
LSFAIQIAPMLRGLYDPLAVTVVTVTASEQAPLDPASVL